MDTEDVERLTRLTLERDDALRKLDCAEETIEELSLASGTLMDRAAKADHIYHELDMELCKILGGWDAMPCKHFYFDDYDRSVELLGMRNGWKPTLEIMTALRALGIVTAWVTYEDGSALVFSQGQLDGGKCSPRTHERDSVGTIKLLHARIREMQEALTDCADGLEAIIGSDRRYKLVDRARELARVE